MEEHAVLLRVPVPPAESGWELVSSLADRLHEQLESSDAGEFDGEEVGEGWATFYCYGPDADRLWDVIASVADLAALPVGAYAEKRYGGPGAESVRVGA